MSEEKKNCLKKQNTIIENKKIKFEKASLINPSDNILQRAKMFEENIVIKNEN